MEEQSILTGVKEIARRANVSLATVDRVINNRGGVSQKTKEKIESIIKDLDYQPNILARRLASPKRIKLATLIPNVSQETSFWESFPIIATLAIMYKLDNIILSYAKGCYDITFCSTGINHCFIVS